MSDKKKQPQKPDLNILPAEPVTTYYGEDLASINVVLHQILAAKPSSQEDKKTPNAQTPVRKEKRNESPT